VTHFEVIFLVYKISARRSWFFCNFSVCESLYSTQEPRFWTKAKWHFSVLWQSGKLARWQDDTAVFVAGFL